MRQYSPLPANIELAPTLARRVRQLREWRNLTCRDLARLARFSINRIDDIESGIETWLSSCDRQMLCKGLGVEPFLLKEVEIRSVSDEFGKSGINYAELIQNILNGCSCLNCPDCGSELVACIQDALDLEGNPTQFAKAYCSKCPFVL